MRIRLQEFFLGNYFDPAFTDEGMSLDNSDRLSRRSLGQSLRTQPAFSARVSLKASALARIGEYSRREDKARWRTRPRSPTLARWLRKEVDLDDADAARVILASELDSVLARWNRGDQRRFQIVARFKTDALQFLLLVRVRLPVIV